MTTHTGTLPAVTVVVPTRDRPELLRRALDAIAAQDYAGELECFVVFDGAHPDLSITRGGDRAVVALTNTRAPGLAGARNTGVLLANTELVAFCDDDDVWLPDKLSTQVTALHDVPGAALVTCGMRVEYDEQTVDRVLPTERVEFDDLLRSRLPELHSSSFVFRRERLVELGMVNECVPGSFGEDYDLLLRSARLAPIVNVTAVHLAVTWHRESHFARRWDTMTEALCWFLAEYPEFDRVPAAAARITGQIAFACAAQGDRSDALRWAGRTVRRNPAEARAYLALAVAGRVIRADTVLDRLHRRGRGI